MGFFLTATFVLSSLSYLNVVSTTPAPVTDSHQASTYFQVPFVDFQEYHLWSEASPFHSVKPYQAPPKGCEITQVDLLQRHGARFPTTSSGHNIQVTLAKIQNATSFDPKMAFMKDFVYDLGVNDLMTFGATQSRDIGVEHFQRYGKLISDKNVPFVRTDESARVAFSAFNWTSGIALASRNKVQPPVSVILSSSGGSNDTLEVPGCFSENFGAQTTKWVNVFGPPIAARLNSMAPGANISNSDVFNFMLLCPFHTLAKQKLSPVCELFTQDDFEKWQYFWDLDYYYSNGYGDALGPVQGVGYINELLARLTNSPVSDQTQTNSTLDSNPETFPFNRTFYADFSHDSTMVAVYSAMGLFKPKADLDPTKPDDNRTWRAGQLVPFSSQMVTERLDCQVDQPGKKPGHSKRNNGNDHKQVKTYVRILVNDALQPLEFCGGDKNGLCELDRFVESQSYARNNGNGDYEKCLAELAQ